MKKSVEATLDLIDNKITDKITSKQKRFCKAYTIKRTQC